MNKSISKQRRRPLRRYAAVFKGNRQIIRVWATCFESARSRCRILLRKTQHRRFLLEQWEREGARVIICENPRHRGQYPLLGVEPEER